MRVMIIFYSFLSLFSCIYWFHKDGFHNGRTLHSHSLSTFQRQQSIRGHTLRNSSYYLVAYSDRDYATRTTVDAPIFIAEDANENMNAVESDASNLQHSKGINRSDAVLVVIVSDRFEGIIPTVASILTHTKSKPIDFVLIGNNQTVNERVRKHFMNNNRNKSQKRADVHRFTCFSILQIQNDLIHQGYQPIWTWNAWGSSRKPDWFRSEYTIRVAEWDSLETHAHELNHLRFYLPHVSHFRNHTYLFFADDDILVQKDLGIIADSTMETLDDDKGLVTPCNIWLWDQQCHHFGFQNEDTIQSILQMPSLYGDRNICQTQSEIHCYPQTYPAFLESILVSVSTDNKTTSNSNNPRKQKAWNFGFSLFALENWRRMNLTARYEKVMKESYRLHVFPEKSLTFGLGAPYIAFAGVVGCWNESLVKVRDGFGFIDYNRFAETFGGNDFLTTNVDVMHYTGPVKPWSANTTIEPRSLQPWLNYMELEGIDIPSQLPKDNGKELFTLLASDRAAAHWMMSLLDNHPAVCASGEGQKPESGFPADSMDPWGTPWLPICSVKVGCSYTFIRNAIQSLVGSMDRRGRSNRIPLRCQKFTGSGNAVSGANGDSDVLGNHLPRVCNFFRFLNNNFTDSAIAATWVEAFRDENEYLLPCSCQRGTVVKGVNILAEWLMYENYPQQSMGPAYLALNATALSGSRIIRLKRRNLWERYVSSVIAQHSKLNHVKSQTGKAIRILAAMNITISISDMLMKLNNMSAIDLAGDNWAKSHGSKVLEVYHEDCRKDAERCFKQIFEFLDVDASFVSAKKEVFESKFASFNKGIDAIHVTNKGAVEEALFLHGYGGYIGASKNFSLTGRKSI
jgi:lipopolysaccharide biosynthesis glycosyltransferase